MLQMGFFPQGILCTVHDYGNDTIFHVCTLDRQHLRPWIDQVAVLRISPERRSPLGLHILFTRRAYEGSLADVGAARPLLLEFVCYSYYLLQSEIGHC